MQSVDGGTSDSSHAAGPSGMKLTVHVVRASPGRLRLKLSRAAQTGSALEAAKRALADVPGVYETRENSLANSVVVRYDPESLSLPQMFAAVVQAGVELDVVVPEVANGARFAVAPDRGSAANIDGPTMLDQAISAFMNDADRRVAELTRGVADLRSLVPVSLAILAAREMLAGRVVATPWYVLAWYAADSYLKLHKSPSSAGETQPST